MIVPKLRACFKFLSVNYLVSHILEKPDEPSKEQELNNCYTKSLHSTRLTCTPDSYLIVSPKDCGNCLRRYRKSESQFRFLSETMHMAITIEKAHAGDASQIAACVSSAYQKYIPIIGKLPEPALDNYTNIVSDHLVWVMRRGKRVVGVIVLMEKEGDLLLDNVAIHPSEQHQGLGRELIAFAEAEARKRGYDAIHLYTHEKMTNNLALYESLGYEETKRISERGYDRVYMRKQL